MSREIITSISVSMKKRTISVSSYSSNDFPKTPVRTVLQQHSKKEIAYKLVDLFCEWCSGNMKVTYANNYKWLYRFKLAFKLLQPKYSDEQLDDIRNQLFKHDKLGLFKPENDDPIGWKIADILPIVLKESENDKYPYFSKAVLDDLLDILLGKNEPKASGKRQYLVAATDKDKNGKQIKSINAWTGGGEETFYYHYANAFGQDDDYKQKYSFYQAVLLCEWAKETHDGCIPKLVKADDIKQKAE